MIFIAQPIWYNIKSERIKNKKASKPWLILLGQYHLHQHIHI